jgi:hypothetical protein
MSSRSRSRRKKNLDPVSVPVPAGKSFRSWSRSLQKQILVPVPVKNILVTVPVQKKRFGPGPGQKRKFGPGTGTTLPISSRDFDCNGNPEKLKASVPKLKNNQNFRPHCGPTFLKSFENISYIVTFTYRNG